MNSQKSNIFCLDTKKLEKLNKKELINIISKYHNFIVNPESLSSIRSNLMDDLDRLLKEKTQN